MTLASSARPRIACSSSRRGGRRRTTRPPNARLALAEAVTLISHRQDPVTDDVWQAAAEHYDERQLAALVLQIANINLWNRLNIATGQQAGAHTW